MPVAPARAAFFGLFVAACLFAAVDATMVLRADVPGLDNTGRILGAVYVTSPFLLAGAVVSSSIAALVAVWHQARRRPSPSFDGHVGPPLVSADGPAAIITFVGFAAACFGATYLIATRTHHRGLGSTAFALFAGVSALLGFWCWQFLRRALSDLDDRLGFASVLRPSRLVGAATLAFVVSLGWATLAKNDALAEVVGTWPPIFAFAFPATAFLLTTLFRKMPEARLGSPSLQRVAVTLALVALAGTADLLRFLDHRPPVKAALLEHTLIFRPLALITQPMFDEDHDGYSGLLGGGDCNDENPAVYPGAAEIPLNGLDDDCFGGDAAGIDVAADEASDDESDAPDYPRPDVLPRPNLIHITIDTLRADHLGAYGHVRETSPNLDALARRGLRFKWAFSQGAQTKVSIPSMFSGRYFSEVERSPDSWATIWPENLLVAERLADAGYHTAGFPSHRFFLPLYGLNQGFHDWDLGLVEKFGPRIVNVSTSTQTTDRVIDWFDARGVDTGPYYVWIHYFDPHHWYQSHDDGEDFGEKDEDRYDEEIRHTDKHVGRLLDHLERAGWLKSSYVFVQGDHGEGFGQHGYRYHGQHLFNDQVRVPLIVAGPALPPRVVEHPVALVDLVPTFLDLAGIDRPLELPGFSVLPFASARTGYRRPPVYIEMIRDSNHSDRRALIEWPWKYQLGITFNEVTLYDLSSDPDEQVDVLAANPPVHERLEKRLRRFMANEVRSIQPRQ